MIMFEELVRHRAEIESYLEKFSSIGIVLIDSARNIQDCNYGFTKIFQLQQKPVGSPLGDYMILSNSDLKQTEEIKISCNHQSGVSGFLHCRAIEIKSGYLLFCERLLLTESRAIEQIGTINNELINLQRETVKKNLLLEKLRRELNERIVEIEATLSRVRQLEGIIPICAYCKKIRDKQDDWHGLEQYISEHSEAQFSHGICPACFEKEMKEIKKDEPT